MTRYRLVSPLGVYAPGTILDTDLPAGQMFSLEWPAARRLTELGVLEPLADPPPSPDEPGWSETATSVSAAGPQSAPAARSAASGGRATATGTGRPKEQSTR